MGDEDGTNLDQGAAALRDGSSSSSARLEESTMRKFGDIARRTGAGAMAIKIYLPEKRT